MNRFQQDNTLRTSHTQVLSPGANSALGFATKRTLDVGGAGTLLVLLSPLMALIAVAIKLDSRGPVIFAQQRVGARQGRLPSGEVVWQVRNFPFYKFRSMYTSIDESLHQAHIQAYVEGRLNESAETFKLKNDPRVTRVGRVLRKTSLDELPQLVNVLKGEMSLVGPRPVPPYEVAQYKEHHCERLAALPGITGLWQVKGRSQVPFEEQIRMDIEYVRNQSLWLDIKLLLQTIPAVLSGRGAG